MNNPPHQAISDLAEVIAFHRDKPFQPLKLTCDELEAVYKLAKFAQSTAFTV